MHRCTRHAFHLRTTLRSRTITKQSLCQARVAAQCHCSYWIKQLRAEGGWRIAHQQGAGLCGMHRKLRHRLLHRSAGRKHFTFEASMLAPLDQDHKKRAPEGARFNLLMHSKGFSPQLDKRCRLKRFGDLKNMPTYYQFKSVISDISCRNKQQSSRAPCNQK